MGVASFQNAWEKERVTNERFEGERERREREWRQIQRKLEREHILRHF